MNKLYIKIGLGAVVLVILVRLCFDVDTPRAKDMQSPLVQKVLENSELDVEQMLLDAKKLIGVRYRAGGGSPQTGFDCSGFVAYCFRNGGIRLVGSSLDISKMGKRVLVGGYSKGDLAFWRGSHGLGIGHVGIITEVYPDNSFDFIHASTSAGVEINHSENLYYKERFVCVKRLW